MNLGEFFHCLSYKPQIYILIFSITFSIYIILFHKKCYHLFDPLLYILLGSAFATSTVIYLFYLKKYDAIYLQNYIITILVYYGIFFIYGKNIPAYNKLKKQTINKGPQETVQISGNFFLVFVFLALFNIFYHLFVYACFGIPLLMNSRLEVNMTGGIFNALLSRFSILFSTISLYMCFYILNYCHYKRRFFAKIYFILVILFGVLSGSKGFLIIIFLNFSYFVYLNQKKLQKLVNFFCSKRMVPLIVLIIISGLFIIFIQSHGNLIDVIVKLLQRFAANGDGYAYAYPNDNIEKVTKLSLFDFLFGDFFQTFRLSSKERGIGFGFELMNIANHVSNSVSGPNPRMNLVGYAYFGFLGSILLAFVTGMIFTYFRNLLIASVNFPIEKQIAVLYFYSIFASFEGDVPSVIKSCTTDMFLSAFLMFFLLLFIIWIKPRKNSLIIK